ncbi:MAG: NAD-dependent protein deacetylase [Mycobacteriales bacterium]
MRSELAPPPETGVAAPALDRLAELVGRGGVTVLSGAGISTESGIPDYRGPSGVRRQHRPMTYQDFVSSAANRRRYWARSYLGWRLITGARPNAGHRAVAALQRAGMVDAVITQNVDGLHQAAGALGVLELHGTLDAVACLDCGMRSARADLDRRMLAANPCFADRIRVEEAHPDGDVPLTDAQIADFALADCLGCGGILKPDVVYFGETVPRVRVERSFALVESASALLVLGSSLTVMSGYRFVLRAATLGIPVAIVNRGATRGDERATVIVDAALGRTLSALVHLVRADA